tara:strand:+ start:6972 stop:7190 length:219 start_codon:yes stop_codon:yes gene_type:complete
LVKNINAPSGNRNRGASLEGKHVTTTPKVLGGERGHRSRCEQDLNLRGQSPIDFKSISLTARTSQQKAHSEI